MYKKIKVKKDALKISTDFEICQVENDDRGMNLHKNQGIRFKCGRGDYQSDKAGKKFCR